MKKNYSIKRALISSVLSFALCFSMLLGATFAWFTDSAISGSNVIKTGNLDIVLEYWDGDSWEDAEGEVIPFVTADGRSQDQILWEPGCTYEMAPFRVRNEGNLSAKILILLNGISGDEKLMEAIELKTRINNIPDSLLNGSAGNVYQSFEDAEVGILYGMAEGNVIFDHSLAAKGQVTAGTGHTDTSPEFTIFGHMAEEAGNEYQNLAIEGISITVIATQQTYESDSFNQYYDKNAQFPTVDYAYIASGAPATTIGEGKKVAVTVPAGVSAGGYQMKVSNENIATDENGLTTLSVDINLLKNGLKIQADGQTLYTVEIDIGTDMQVEKVLHNGEEVANYSYDPATGIVTFETDSFSPFEVKYIKVPEGSHKVVTDGKTKYFLDIHEAVEAAKGQTAITLGSDVVLEETLVFDNDATVSLDMNGFSVSGQLETLVKIADGTLSVKNGSFKNVHDQAGLVYYNIYMCGDATAEIKDVTITTSGIGIMMTENSKITELNAKIDSFMHFSKDNCFDAISLVENARIDLISGGEYKARYTENIANLKVQGSSITYAPGCALRLNDANTYVGEISGGTFLSVDDTGGMGAPIYVNNGTLNLISGGHFGFTELGVSYNTFNSIFENTTNGGKINAITGGTFVKGSYGNNKTGFKWDFASLVDASGCKIVDTGETSRVSVQFSTKINTYDLAIIEVVAK